MKSYAERLLWALDQANMSQSELARRCGIKPQSVQYLCDLKRNAKGSSHTSCFAKILGVNVDWLATGQGQIYTTSLTIHETTKPFDLAITDDQRRAMEYAHILTPTQLTEWFRWAEECKQENREVIEHARLMEKRKK
jgi:transcriptional regulator with XRE-family HTH domain